MIKVTNSDLHIKKKRTREGIKEGKTKPLFFLFLSDLMGNYLFKMIASRIY